MSETIPRHRVLAKIKGKMAAGYEDVLTPDALLFLADLERRFGRTRRNLLEDRVDRQDRFDHGELPAFYRKPPMCVIPCGKLRRSPKLCKIAA